MACKTVKTYPSLLDIKINSCGLENEITIIIGSRYIKANTLYLSVHLFYMIIDAMKYDILKQKENTEPTEKRSIVYYIPYISLLTLSSCRFKI